MPADPPFSRRALLSLGSNLGDRADLLGRAMAALEATPGIRLVTRSRLYRTPPWGDADQGEFLNAACAIETTLDPDALLESCQAIERQLGREPTRRWGPRRIDIDILHVEGIALADPHLTLPHPHWQERGFVLVPLAEIAQDLVIAGCRVRDALARVDASDIVAAGEARQP